MQLVEADMFMDTYTYTSPVEGPCVPAGAGLTTRHARYGVNEAERKVQLPPARLHRCPLSHERGWVQAGRSASRVNNRVPIACSSDKATGLLQLAT